MEVRPMKFSIRDLLLILAIIALTVGWGLDHWWQAASFQKFRVFHDKEMRSREVTIGELMKYVRPAMPNSSAPVANPPKP